MRDEFQSSALSLMPDILLDVEKTLLKWKQTSKEKTIAKINSLEKYTKKCKQLNQQLLDQKKVASDLCKKLQIDNEEIIKDLKCEQKEEQDVEGKFSVLRKLSKQKTIILPVDNKLNNLRHKACLLEEERKRIKVAIMRDFKMFQKGICYYKKYLHFNVIYMPEKHIIFTYDVSAQNESEAREFIKFTVRNNGLSFQYVGMCPNIEMEKCLLRFKETGNIQELILSFWKLLKRAKRKY